MQFNPLPNPSLSSTHTAHHYSQPQTNQTPTPSPYHNFNPTCTIQHVIQSPQSLLPQKRKHALPSTSRPNPLPQHHSQNVPFLIYHDNPPPPHSYSSSKIHRSSRTLTFNPQSIIHIFFLIAQFCIQLCLQSYCQRFKQKSISRLIATKH